MSASWVHEDIIPQSAVTEFQSGIMPEVHIDEESSCNQLSFTANVHVSSNQEENNSVGYHLATLGNHLFA